MDKLEEAKKIQSNYHTKAFYLMLEIAVAFLVPAVFVVWLSRSVEVSFMSQRKFGLVLLLVAFVVSWAYVIYRYIKITKQIREIDAKVKALKSEQK